MDRQTKNKYLCLINAFDLKCFSGGNNRISVLISFIDTVIVELFYNRALMNTGTRNQRKDKNSFHHI